MKELDSVDFANDTPLLDLLDAIPLNGRAVYHTAKWSKNVPYGNLCAQAAMRIRALEEEVKAMKSNWISVKERLPELPAPNPDYLPDNHQAR